MNPIDPRTLELIHAELDDELDAAGREELSARLAADPSARDQRDQLQRMAQALALLAPVEPPTALRQRWHSPRPVATPAARPAPRRWLRPALAIAASGVLVAVAIGLGGVGREPMDGDQLVGTMAPASPDPEAVRYLPVDADGIRGSVRLERGKDGWDLVFDLDSDVPVSVDATYDPTQLRLEGYARAGSGERPFKATPGRIAFVNDGAQHLHLHLQPGKGGQVGIVFEGPEGVLKRLAIAVPPTPAD